MNTISTVVVGLEWFGTLFMGVEAIKLKNLAIIRRRLKKTMGRLHPITNILKDAPDIAVAERRAGTVWNLWTITGMCFFAWLSAIFGFNNQKIVAAAQAWLPKLQYIEVVIVLVGGIILILGATGAGYILFRLGLLVLVFGTWSLSALERNTASGVVGIIGIILFSMASVLKLSGFE